MAVKVLVTGSEGQLARSLAERGAGRPDMEIVRVGRPELDLKQPETIRRAIREVAPDVVISAAAYTAVDRAEDAPEIAMCVNGEGPGFLARAARAANAKIIHVSTDYVYDGRKAEAYVETDRVGPQSVYGRTKLKGEERVRAEHREHVIVRTAWVYSPFGNNFVKTILDRARIRSRLTLVDDQLGSPTSALDLADALLAIIQRWRHDRNTGLGETYHCAGSGQATWCDFARHVLAVSRVAGGPVAEVDGIPSSDWPTKAVRPANSRLDCNKLAHDFAWEVPDWHLSVDIVVRRLWAMQDSAAA